PRVAVSRPFRPDGALHSGGLADVSALFRAWHARRHLRFPQVLAGLAAHYQPVSDDRRGLQPQLSDRSLAEPDLSSALHVWHQSGRDGDARGGCRRLCSLAQQQGASFPRRGNTTRLVVLILLVYLVIYTLVVLRNRRPS